MRSMDKTWFAYIRDPDKPNFKQTVELLEKADFNVESIGSATKTSQYNDIDLLISPKRNPFKTKEDAKDIVDFLKGLGAKVLSEFMDNKQYSTSDVKYRCELEWDGTKLDISYSSNPHAQKKGFPKISSVPSMNEELLPDLDTLLSTVYDSD